MENENGNDLFETDVTFPYGSAIWKPNGEYALIGNRYKIFRYNGDSLTEIETYGHGFISASWEPSGKYVLLADGGFDEIGHYDGENFTTLSTNDTFAIDGGINVDVVSFSPTSEYALIGTQAYAINGPYQMILGYNGTDFEIVEGPLYQFPGRIVWNPNGTYESFETKYGLYGWSPDGSYNISILVNRTNKQLELWRTPGINISESIPSEDPLQESDSESEFISIHLGMIVILAVVTIIGWLIFKSVKKR